MPAEYAPHERTLMAWPARPQLWERHFEQAKADYAEIANAIAAFEPVMMVADPSQAGEARAACGEGVEVAEIPIDDSWMRDSGPIFVLDGAGGRAGVDFAFNAWGEKFEPYDDDAEMAARVLEHLGEERIDARDLVLEGGSIAGDGEGTLITTEQCLLHPNRNPGRSTRADRAPAAGDARRPHRRLARPRPGRGPATPTATSTTSARGSGRAACCCRRSPTRRTRTGRARARTRERLQAAGLEVVELPLLPYVDHDGPPTVVPYTNFYVCNGALIVPVTGQETDAEALALLGGLYPGREVVPVPGVTLASAAAGSTASRSRSPPWPEFRARGACTTRRPARLQPRAADRADRSLDSRGVSEPRLITAIGDVPPSLARVEAPTREPFRDRRRAGGLARRRRRAPWRRSSAGSRWRRGRGRSSSACRSSRSRPTSRSCPTRSRRPRRRPEPIPGGPTTELAAAPRASTASTCTPRSTSTPTTAGSATTPRSSWRPRRPGRPTRKLHIPVTAGYYEDRYFRPGDDAKGYPVVALGDARFGFPTCWDQWFPELARAYSLGGAEVIVYPTAIGSEPDHPDFDTQPLWEHVITGNGIANGTFMVAVNRIGHEPPLTLLRLVVHLRPLRPRAGPGAARRAGRARRRPRPRPAARLARAVPVPAHPPARHLRGAAGRGRPALAGRLPTRRYAPRKRDARP